MLPPIAVQRKYLSLLNKHFRVVLKASQIPAISTMSASQVTLYFNQHFVPKDNYYVPNIKIDLTPSDDEYMKLAIAKKEPKVKAVKVAVAEAPAVAVTKTPKKTKAVSVAAAEMPAPKAKSAGKKTKAVTAAAAEMPAPKAKAKSAGKKTKAVTAAAAEMPAPKAKAKSAGRKKQAVTAAAAAMPAVPMMGMM